MALASRVRELHFAGKGQAEIAAELRISEDEVVKIRRQLGLARPPNRSRAAMQGEGLTGGTGRADKGLRKF